MEQHAARGQLLRYLAASPLISAPSIASSIAALIASAPNEASAQSYEVLRAAGGKVGDFITSPSQALNVLDFEPAAKHALAAAPAHFGYLESGVDDDGTLKANRDAFEQYTVRVRRLVDARKLYAFKALALGATAVGIGRPYCWGLAAFGEPGVDRVLELVQTEFETIMKQAGTTALTQISSQYVTRA